MPEKKGMNPPLSLAGHTMQWSFTEGPTAGTTYEHTFRPDGTVVWRDVKSGAKAASKARKSTTKKSDAETHYASFEIANGLHLVSYLSAESGYTLTVAVNTNDKTIHGVASNATDWFPVEGTLAREVSSG